MGAAGVAFWFFVVDLLTSTPFYTPAALGSALLLGAAGASVEIQVNFGVVVAYSFLHVAVFALIGVTFAWLADRVEHAPGFLMRAASVLIAVEALFLGTVSISSGWLLDTLGWTTILVGNALAVVTMSAWIWRKHPKLRERLIGQAVAHRA